MLHNAKTDAVEENFDLAHMTNHDIARFIHSESEKSLKKHLARESEISIIEPFVHQVEITTTVKIPERAVTVDDIERVELHTPTGRVYDIPISKKQWVVRNRELSQCGECGIHYDNVVGHICEHRNLMSGEIK